MVSRLLVAIVLSAALVPATALAGSQEGTTAEKAWHGDDDCARKAFKLFPDYTPESNAKRDRAMRRCTATGQVPSRADIAPPAPGPTAPPADAAAK